MSDRQWPATKLGSAWLTYDPDDGWSEHDNPSDAEREFGAIVDHLRDESSDGWHESADAAAWGIWIPIERLRLVATAWAEDDTEEGERCRDAGWDAALEGTVERVEIDAAAIDFCGRRESSAFKALREERDTARAEADALRAEVAALKAAAKPDPLRVLLEHLDANDAEIEITRTAGGDDDDPATWMISYTICGSGSWAEGALDAAARQLCDPLGVDHG